MDSNCVGIVKIPLSLLSFSVPHEFYKDNAALRAIQKEQLLRIDAKRVKQLARIFRKGQCKPLHPDHLMLGAITLGTFESILGALQLSREELLQKSLSQDYPFLNGDFKIWCVQGKIRALAARLAFGEKAWWAVKLHTEAAGPECMRVLYHSSEQFSHETSYSDGAIYRKIRYYMVKGEPDEAEVWLFRLSNCKRKSLNTLFKEKAVYQALDELLPYTGLWDGLQLGNMHKHLALHCPNPIISYFHNIRDAYNRIFRGAEQFKSLLDVDTVLFLQYKCPSASTDDRKLIEDAMRRRQIFILIPDGKLRSTILTNILSLQVVIPSITSFHHNMKYFSIGAKILQKHVECVEPRGRKDKRPSLFENLCADWKLPEKCVIQVRKDSYESLNQPLTPELANVLLFLDAIRDFPWLCSDLPLQGTQGERTVEFPDEGKLALLRAAKLAHFREGARILGYQSAKLRQLSSVRVPSENTDLYAKPTLSYNWRGGKPSVAAFLQLQTCAFLPILYQAQDTSTMPSVSFVQNDFIRSFFGTFDIRQNGDVEMSEQCPQDNYISTILSPGRVDIQSRQQKPITGGAKGRVKKRAQPEKNPLSSTRLEASLTRQNFDFSMRMPEQRQERRPELHAEEGVEVEMTPAVDSTEQPEIPDPLLTNQVIIHPPTVPTRIARRSIQIPSSHLKLPRETPPSKLGKRRLDDLETDDTSIDIRPRAKNFKRARFIENRLAAIREDQQPQFHKEIPSAVDTAGLGLRGEAVRSIQIPRTAQKDTSRLDSTAYSNRRAGRLFETSLQGLPTKDQETPNPENAKVSEELPVQIDATTALSFAHVFGEDEEEEL
ncbi:hypothetical protein HD806DRAFT_536094 [Xylariaceae sp. AK1471]|nr:hypothetical protein HD806DRAFT_536094 [Xylariaceae sp. AK1471]